MPRPIQALIHTGNIAHNLSRARTAANGAKVLAVVKANAYGHGIERVFGALAAGADGIALLDLEEAKRVRSLGWAGPILLLEGCFQASDLELCSQLNLWHAVHQEQQIDWLTAHQPRTLHQVFLKLNSGMNRLGFTPLEFRAAWSRLKTLPGVGDIAFMTHFSDADGPRGIDHQVATFKAASEGMRGRRSMSNSAALLRHGADSAVCADWVRAGVMLYGCAPDFPEHDIDHWQLKPTMTLRSRVLAVQHLKAGDSVGYGSSFLSPTDMRIGIVACGYADGYPRHAPHGTPVLVNGRRTTTVGRVSMDMLAVDLTTIGGAGIGSEVTLWGLGPNESSLPIDEVAHASRTIGYELMCALAQRVPVSVGPYVEQT